MKPVIKNIKNKVYSKVENHQKSLKKAKKKNMKIAKQPINI